MTKPTNDSKAPQYFILILHTHWVVVIYRGKHLKLVIRSSTDKHIQYNVTDKIESYLYNTCP